MNYYINYKIGRRVKTIDSAVGYKEALRIVAEYNIAFKGGCYISRRATKGWRENK